MHQDAIGLVYFTAEEAAILAPFLVMVSWECEECRTPHTTPKGLWPYVVYNLTCTGCHRIQRYDGYIDKVPVP